jgi:hypothetical protein
MIVKQAIDLLSLSSQPSFRMHIDAAMDIRFASSFLCGFGSPAFPFLDVRVRFDTARTQRGVGAPVTITRRTRG